MNASRDHQFFLSLVRGDDDRRPLRQTRVDESVWRPAIEFLRLESLVRDKRESPSLPEGAVRIEPIWRPDRGEPFVGGVRISLPVDRMATGADSLQAEFAADYFADAGQQLVNEYVREIRESSSDAPDAEDAGQRLGGAAYEPASPFHHAPSSYHGDEEANAPECDLSGLKIVASAIRIDDAKARDDATDRNETTRPARSWAVAARPQPLALERLPLDELLRGCEIDGDIDEDDLPVLIPDRLLQETLALHDRAGANETGGTLIGVLGRDTERPERLYVRVAAQIPARHAQHELTRLTFTADTWSDADAVIRLRARGERKLGWWHSHPARRWCERCPEENRRVCRLSGEFFSSHDAAVHRAAFSFAAAVALVVSDSFAEGISFPLFGWRRGRLVRRGFHRIPDGHPLEAQDELAPGRAR